LGKFLTRKTFSTSLTAVHKNSWKYNEGSSKCPLANYKASLIISLFCPSSPPLIHSAIFIEDQPWARSDSRFQGPINTCTWCQSVFL
jgi:hypothetical protein